MGAISLYLGNLLCLFANELHQRVMGSNCPFVRQNTPTDILAHFFEYSHCKLMSFCEPIAPGAACHGIKLSFYPAKYSYCCSGRILIVQAHMRKRFNIFNDQRWSLSYYCNTEPFPFLAQICYVCAIKPSSPLLLEHKTKLRLAVAIKISSDSVVAFVTCTLNANVH